MPVPTALSFLGVGKETVPGTGVVPTSFIPLKTIEPLDKVEYFPVTVLMGSAAEDYGEVPGYKWAEWNAAGPIYPDTFAWLAGGLLGDMTVSLTRTVADGVTTNGSTTFTSATGAFALVDVGKPLVGTGIPAGTYVLAVLTSTTVQMSQAATASGSSLSVTIGQAGTFTNTFSLLNSGTGQPTSQSLTDFYAVTQARQFAGVQWHEVDFKFTTDGLLDHTSKATGFASVPVAKPAQSFTTALPLPTWSGNINIGGTIIVKGVDGNITLTRKVAVVKAMTGTQRPAAIFIGGLTVKGKLWFFIDDDTEILRYLNNTQPSLDMLWATGSGATYSAVNFHSSKAAYTNGKLNRSKDYMQVECDFTSVATVADAGASGGYSPCLIRCISAVNGGYV